MFPRYLGTNRQDNINIVIPANSGSKATFKFDDQPNLRNSQENDIAIQAIETYCIFDVPQDPDGNVLATDVQLQATFLTLYTGEDEGIFRFPMISLRRVANAVNATQNIPYTKDLQIFDNLEIMWEKSYVTNPAGFGGNALFSFMFVVHYLKLPPGTLKRLRQIKEGNYCNLAATK